MPNVLRYRACRFFLSLPISCYCLLLWHADCRTKYDTRDFEKFLQHLKQNKLSLSFDSYGDYAVSVLNFYVGSSLLKPADKRGRPIPDPAV